MMDEAERQAMESAQRAQGIASGGVGAYAIPFTLDPTVVLTNNGTINPIRQVARKVQITTNSWQGVTSAGATASWDAEAAEVSDDAITLVQPAIPVYKGQAFVPFSVEIGGDWPGIESDLRMALSDAKDRLESTAHVSGSGSAQPTGIATELDGTSSEIAPATAETFAIADVYNLQRVLPARYRPTAAWMAALGTYGKIRQFDTGGGGGLWTQLGDGTPEQLLGKPAYEHSEMRDWNDLNAAATADNFLLFIGDWSRYVIVDRVGMTVELVPHLFHTSNNRPSGQRGILAWWRSGAESIDDNAFRMLSIPTTA
jgi:HK97 family phage major capsid protein